MARSERELVKELQSIELEAESTSIPTRFTALRLIARLARVLIEIMRRITHEV